MCVSVSTQEDKPGENPLSLVADSSPGVIHGKADVRELILGEHPFNTDQGGKR